MPTINIFDKLKKFVELDQKVIEHLRKSSEEAKENLSKDLILPDKEAMEFLRSEIIKLKNSGKNQIDIIYLYDVTRLPIEQLSRLTKKLEEEGVLG